MITLRGISIALAMTLIKSISGIRGTIGGAPGDNLDAARPGQVHVGLRPVVAGETTPGGAGACGSSSDATLACRVEMAASIVDGYAVRLRAST